MELTKTEIINKLRFAGVVGSGGAGFPAYVKLDSTVETIIANGVECEPLLYSDKTVMTNFASEVIKGLEIAIFTTRAKKAYIAIKKNNPKILAVLNEHIKENKKIEIIELDHFYPAGDEFVLVYEVTKKIIPEANIPLSVGVLVNNVTTLRNIYKASLDKPLTHTFVTVTGEVKNPKVFKAPIGCSYSKLIELAGGPLIDNFSVIDGGPMMGKIVENIDDPISKTTTGIILLSKTHVLISERNKKLDLQEKRAKTTCNQCTRCTEFCPRVLLGHSLVPNKMMTSDDYNGEVIPEYHRSANFCCLCNLCTFFSCEMGLSPRAKYENLKLKLDKDSFSEPKKGNFVVDANREFKKLSTKRLIFRTNIEKYNRPLEFDDIEIKPNKVKIYLNQHIGAPSTPIVKKEEYVKKGDVIATFDEAKLGVNIHASIDGKVTSVTERYIEISC
ncbi:MAG: SLBB domain-containing protein [Pseudomonadota bacterium]